MILAILVALYTYSFDRVEGELRADAEGKDQQEVRSGLRALAAPAGLLVGAAVMS